MTWISLHTHSQYSILDSTISVRELAQQAADYAMPALALTDFCNMYGAVDFAKACDAAGVRPIIGIEISIAPSSRKDKAKLPGKASGYPVILLAKDTRGYQNLCALSSLGFLEGFYYTPRIDKEILSQHAEGLICLSGGVQGFLAAADDLEAEVAFFQQLFGEDFYLELQRHTMSNSALDAHGIRNEVWLVHKYEEYIRQQEALNQRFIELSKKKGVALVATNDIHYLQPDDWNAHEILLNVQSGEPCEIWERDAFGNPKARVQNPKRKVYATHELYFKSPEQMAELFSDIPEAIATSAHIADKCAFSFDFKARYYPVFTPPTLSEAEASDESVRKVAAEKYLETLCEEAIATRYSPAHLEKIREKYPEKEPMDIVRHRLEHELEIIFSKGLCDYLLIVHDFIAWSKKQKIPVGPGRGSGAGSIILYLIGITDIEPLRFNLFFERFINPERLSYPDIDVDICMDRRSEVIEYTLEKYGRDKVAQIITFGTMKAKMAIKDVGRVLSVPLAKVNEIAKLVPEDPNMTLEKAFELDPDLSRMREEDEEARRTLDLAQKVEGSIRNTGVHAAGLIICGDPLTNHIPVCTAKDSEIVTTQYAMKPVEAVGMLKIDFLGLKTLTSIQKACDAVEARTGTAIDWGNLPLDDQPTFNLLNQGHTSGVFQLESTGMQELAKNLHIDRFEEIIAVGALYRPGPMEMIPSFINRKHGREVIEIDHPLMKEVIEETYGIMVYQEQVMQIAQILAKYTLGEGDVLRRAMGKKDREEMMRQREKFRLGAIENGIPEQSAMLVFDKIEKFASYGFNKSHAAAYGYLSYATAYFKANYPKEWMAALMTCDMDDISKVSKHIRESQAMDIAIFPPDVNESGSEFVATDEGIRFALSGIKGVGRGVVEAIIDERHKAGNFSSFEHFLQRIDARKVGKKSIENLIDAGCFDFTGAARKALRATLPSLFENVVKRKKEEEKGFLDMFSDMLFDPPAQPELGANCEYSSEELLVKEKELLGFYLTGHPMDAYREVIEKLGCISLADLSEAEEGAVCSIAGIIDVAKVRYAAKSGRKFAIIVLSDGIDRFEMPIWPTMFEANPALFDDNALLYAIVRIEREEGGLKLRPHFIDDLRGVDDDKIAAFQEARRDAEQQVKADAQRKKSGKKAMKSQDKTPNRRLIVNFDIEKVRFSHILEIKKCFTQSAGTMPVTMQFSQGSTRIGTVEVGSELGVSADQKLKDYILSLPFVLEQRIVEE